jgi:hypothetical protein
MLVVTPLDKNMKKSAIDLCGCHRIHFFGHSSRVNGFGCGITDPIFEYHFLVKDLCGWEEPITRPEGPALNSRGRQAVEL